MKKHDLSEVNCGISKKGLFFFFQMVPMDVLMSYRDDELFKIQCSHAIYVDAGDYRLH